METLIVVTVIVLAAKIIIRIWKSVGKTIILILGIMFLTSDFFLDAIFKDNLYLKTNGYGTGSEGIHNAVKHAYDNREAIAEDLSLFYDAVKDTIRVRIESTPLALNKVDIWGRSIDSLGTGLSTDEDKHLIDEHNKENDVNYR